MYINFPYVHFILCPVVKSNRHAASTGPLARGHLISSPGHLVWQTWYYFRTLLQAFGFAMWRLSVDGTFPVKTKRRWIHRNRHCTRFDTESQEKICEQNRLEICPYRRYRAPIKWELWFNTLSNACSASGHCWCYYCFEEIFTKW